MLGLVVLTGASGSGKTTLAQTLARKYPGACELRYFDTVGVPSPEEMKRWGDGHQPGGAWQRAMTLEWFRRLAALRAEGRPVLFEGQMRPLFIREALEKERLRARVVLLDCDDATRERRLQIDRAQAYLAGDDMMTWARFLRGEANDLGYEVLDTSNVSIDVCVEQIHEWLR